MKAAALTPPAGGLLSTVVGGAAGSLLANEYVLQAPEGVPLPADSPSEVVRQNLTALSCAVRLVEAGDLRGALDSLDSLTGQCREMASAWVVEARHALLLQQVVQAAQANTRCVNAMLL